MWQDADIGSAAISGLDFTLLGSGADIWGTSDAFHFLWQTNSGDGTITARVTNQAADPWSKAGVMIRESTAANARNVFIGLTPGHGVTFQNRPATGGSSYSTALAGIAAPYWVRLTWNGTTFTAHNNALASAATFGNVTPPNVAPVLNAIANQTIIAGQTLLITNVATDPNVPPQTLTFSLLALPAGASIGPVNGVFTWRHGIAQSPLVTMIQVMVAVNGSPSLSDTQSLLVTVNQPASPVISASSMSAGMFSLLANGDPGPDYQLQSATNLAPPVNWRSVTTNLSVAPPFKFTDPAATNFINQHFYRVLLGP